MQIRIQQLIALFLLILLFACNPNENDALNSNIQVSDIVGSWSCKENSFIHGSSSFTVKINKDTTRENGIFIDNFYHSGNDQQVYATMVNGIINLPNQNFCDYKLNVWGTGTVSTNKKTIDWLYYVSTDSDIDSVSAQFVR